MAAAKLDAALPTDDTDASRRADNAIEYDSSARFVSPTSSVAPCVRDGR